MLAVTRFGYCKWFIFVDVSSVFEKNVHSPLIAGYVFQTFCPYLFLFA